MKNIARQFGLDLEGVWNKELMRHLGRHPDKYHDFVLLYMEKAAREAKGDSKVFLELFEKYIKDPVRINPDMLNKGGW